MLEVEDIPKQRPSKTTKIIAGVVAVIVVIVFLIAVINTSKNADTAKVDTSTTNNIIETKTKTAHEIISDKIIELMSSKSAFDAGSYVKGDIPVGEYAFIPFDGSGQYYSEEDNAGNIVDNENFDSFGYVYVQGVGNIQVDSVLVNVEAFNKLNVTSAKEIYQQLNDVKSYNQGGYYKVGADIKPGTYTIKSLGEGYASVETGPVGNSEIVDNNNFNGKWSVTLKLGQYLKISRAVILD